MLIYCVFDITTTNLLYQMWLNHRVFNTFIIKFVIRNKSTFGFLHQTKQPFTRDSSFSKRTKVAKTLIFQQFRTNLRKRTHFSGSVYHIPNACFVSVYSYFARVAIYLPAPSHLRFTRFKINQIKISDLPWKI